MNPVASILWRTQVLLHKIHRHYAWWRLARYDYRLAGTVYVSKGWTVIKLLERHRPASILEFGSGESSGWFAAYAAKHPGTVVISYDEWPEWQQRTTKVAQAIGGVNFRIAQKIIRGKAACYDIGDYPPCEFVFVDGPHHATDIAGIDAQILLPNAPKVVCFDGRTTGVDGFLGKASDYVFLPQMIYCFERGMLWSAIALREQSVFVRK